MSTQYFTYTFLSLLAELGGYIGLFVGASAYSILEGGVDWGARVCKKQE